MRRKIQVLALVALIISIYVIAVNIPYAAPDPEETRTEDKSAGEAWEQTKEAADTGLQRDEEAQPTEENEGMNIRDPLVNDIDFESYREINEDVYAYIYIPNTKIDYPILQHKSDNSYYLNHCMDGTEGYPGCIYTEKENSKDFTDPNTVIYGHNMKNGSMFHDIHLFEDREFFDENEYIYVYTPEKVLKYEIFAVYTATDDHLLYICDYADKKSFGEYLNGIKNKTASYMYSKTALVRKQTELSSNDKIISLQTCTQNEDRRTVMQAVLIEVYD